jgi:hypothetical protein
MLMVLADMECKEASTLIKCTYCATELKLCQKLRNSGKHATVTRITILSFPIYVAHPSRGMVVTPT